MPSQTVLIVEDVETCREPIAAVLRLKGYRVICAENARRARQALEEHSPDVVLLDLALPDVSGLDFLKELRESQLWHDLPAVVFSGSGDVSPLMSGLGVTACLVKSQSSTTQIRAAIERALHPR